MLCVEWGKRRRLVGDSGKMDPLNAIRTSSHYSSNVVGLRNACTRLSLVSSGLAPGCRSYPLKSPISATGRRKQKKGGRRHFPCICEEGGGDGGLHRAEETLGRGGGIQRAGEDQWGWHGVIVCRGMAGGGDWQSFLLVWRGEGVVAGGD